MKKKLFLTGIAGILTIFALALTGCPTGGDDDDGGGGGGDNPLRGTWANDQNLANINRILIFTESPVSGPGVAPNTKLAYYAQNLTGNVDYTVNGQVYQIPIGNPAVNYTADVSELNSNVFSLQGYIDPAPADNPQGTVRFKRAQGTTGSGLRGIWISELPPAASQTIILIGGSNDRKVWSAAGGNVAAPNYRLSEDAGNSYISWNGGANNIYTTTTIANTTTLNITPPGGGAAVDFYPLYPNPEF